MASKGKGSLRRSKRPILQEDIEDDLSIKIPRLDELEEEDRKINTLSPSVGSISGRRESRHGPDKPAELFRKDLISAMKLADTEQLQPDDYLFISDPWRQDWERGVQVPVNPDTVHKECNVCKVFGNEAMHGSYAFKLPKKFLHAINDETYKQGIHELHETQKLSEQVCRYDLDDLDVVWLNVYNDERQNMGVEPVLEWTMERILEEIENQCYNNMQTMIKTVEGLGIEYDENVVCDVCRSPDGEDNNEIVFCDGCDICVHQACYGITKIPEGSWLCRTCALGIQPKCILCPKSGGAMKSTKSGSKWAHVSCALWIPEVSIGCPEKMEPVNKISQIPSSRWSLICHICRERDGACIQCSVKTCKTAFHVTCAFNDNLFMKTVLDESRDDVQLKAYCNKHTRRKEGDTSPRKEPVTPTKRDNILLREPGTPMKKESEMTEEEKKALRSYRLTKLAEEFYSCVETSEVSEALQMDEETIDVFLNYWVLKRKANFNKPLLMPKTEEADLLLKQREDSLIARMKMFIHLRQDLERVRNLCYMVTKREKIRRSLYSMKERIIMAQMAAVDSMDRTARLETRDWCMISTAHREPLTIYDQYDALLYTARVADAEACRQAQEEMEEPEASTSLQGHNGKKPSRDKRRQAMKEASRAKRALLASKIDKLHESNESKKFLNSEESNDSTSSNLCNLISRTSKPILSEESDNLKNSCKDSVVGSAEENIDVDTETDTCQPVVESSDKLCVLEADIVENTVQESKSEADSAKADDTTPGKVNLVNVSKSEPSLTRRSRDCYETVRRSLRKRELPEGDKIHNQDEMNVASQQSRFLSNDLNESVTVNLDEDHSVTGNEPEIPNDSEPREKNHLSIGNERLQQSRERRNSRSSLDSFDVGAIEKKVHIESVDDKEGNSVDKTEIENTKFNSSLEIPSVKDNNTISVTPVSQKRGRGRPRKYPKIDSSQLESSILTPEKCARETLDAESSPSSMTVPSEAQSLSSIHKSDRNIFEDIKKESLNHSQSEEGESQTRDASENSSAENSTQLSKELGEDSNSNSGSEFLTSKDINSETSNLSDKHNESPRPRVEVSVDDATGRISLRLRNNLEPKSDSEETVDKDGISFTQPKRRSNRRTLDEELLLANGDAKLKAKIRRSSNRLRSLGINGLVSPSQLIVSQEIKDKVHSRLGRRSHKNVDKCILDSSQRTLERYLQRQKSYSVSSDGSETITDSRTSKENNPDNGILVRKLRTNSLEKHVSDPSSCGSTPETRSIRHTATDNGRWSNSKEDRIMNDDSSSVTSSQKIPSDLGNCTVTKRNDALVNSLSSSKLSLSLQSSSQTPSESDCDMNHHPDSDSDYAPSETSDCSSSRRATRSVTKFQPQDEISRDSVASSVRSSTRLNRNSWPKITLPQS